MKVYAPVQVRALEQVGEQVRRAEALGYDGATFSETVLDPFLSATLAAAYSQRLLLGTAIALAFPRSPMTTAYMAWNLQRFSRGRFQLGLGTQVKGHNERRFSVPWLPPGPRMREYLGALKAIWACWQNSGPLTFRGQFYSFTLMTPEFNPGPIPYPPPSLYISAVNPYMLRLAGEACDGVLLHPFTTRKYLEEVILPNLEAGAKKGDRRLKDLDISGGGFIVTGANQEELQKEYEVTRRRIAFYASTRTYRPVLEVYGWGEVCDRLHEMSLRGQWAEMPRLITDEIMEACCVVAPYHALAQRVRTRFGFYATRVPLPLPDGRGEAEAQLGQVVQALKGL